MLNIETIYYKPEQDSGQKRILTPEQIGNGKLEFGFSGEPADAIYVVSGISGVANGGPLTQTREVIRGVKQILQSKPDISFGVVVPQGEGKKYQVDSSDVVLEITPGQTVADRYQVAKESMIRLLEHADTQRQKRIILATNGYTGYLPWGVKEAIKSLRSSGKCQDLDVHVVIQDSCFPDTDCPSDDLDQDRIPIDRFAPSAYISDKNLGVNVFMMINNWLPVDPRDSSSRAPDGVVGMAASFPFTDEYLNFWMESNHCDKQAARAIVAAQLSSESPTLSALLQSDDVIFIPLIGSQGYWDKGNIGKWMTEDQYNDTIAGSRLLIEAAKRVAEQTGKTVLLTGSQGFVDVARIVDDVYVDAVPIFSADQNTGCVVVVQAPFMDQYLYRFFARAGDIHVHRTSQANSMPEMMATGVPAILLSMPQQGYMSVETMDRLFGSLNGVSETIQVGPYHTSQSNVDDLAASIIHLLDPEKAREQVLRQAIAYGACHFDKRRNFFSLFGHVAGIARVSS